MPCRGFLNNGIYRHFGFYNGGGMIFMMGFGLLIFLAIIFLGLKIMKQNTIPHFSQQDNSALNILNERFAKGEINEEEYSKMKAELKK